MRKSDAAASPEAYVGMLGGWQRPAVEILRRTVLARGEGLVETVKWRHLVYLGRGPAILIRAEERRALFGFWRGRRMLDLEPRLRGGGKYEMASWEIGEETVLEPSHLEALVRRAVELDRELGDPTRS